MTDDQAQIEAITLASKGTVLAVQAVGDVGMLGLIKVGKAAKDALRSVPDGPASELIRAAGERANDPDDPLGEAEIRAVTDEHWETEAVTTLADSLLDRGLLVIDTMPADASTQVKRWLYGVADSVASAAKDRGEHEKVSAAERDVLDRLRTRFGL